jgi:hypothetical protein
VPAFHRVECGLEHLVGVKCQPPVQQILGMGEGFGRRQLEVIRDTWNALTAPGKRSADRVARAGASGSAGVIAITFGHVPTVCAGVDAAASRDDRWVPDPTVR